MPWSTVRVGVEDGLGWLILDRSEKLNAMNKLLLREAREALEELERRREVAIIALTGEGKVFSAGIDLSEVASASNSDEAAEPFRELAAFASKLLSVEKPVILALNGSAYGGGAELVWVADIVVAVKGSKLVWAEARWGLVPPLLTTIGLLSVGASRAAYIAMTSGELSVEKAYELGIVASVVDNRDELRGAVYEIARKIMSNSPEAVYSAKKIIARAKLSTLVGLGISELERLSRTTQALEAAKAFTRKQTPRYRWV